nr:AAA family ATPase [Acetobacter thailandicus]
MKSRDLSVVVGYTGTGKSTMLGVARAAWEEAGYRVRDSLYQAVERYVRARKLVEGLEHEERVRRSPDLRISARSRFITCASAGALSLTLQVAGSGMGYGDVKQKTYRKLYVIVDLEDRS